MAEHVPPADLPASVSLIPPAVTSCVSQVVLQPESVMKPMRFVSLSYLKVAAPMRFVSLLVQAIPNVRPVPTVARMVFV
jgi:hypothetical protein